MNLTKRETEVLQMMCRGDSNRAIAIRLNVTHRTVGSHRYNLGKKTGCTSTAQLGVWAVRNGLA